MVSEESHFQDNIADHLGGLDSVLSIHEDMDATPTPYRSLLESALIFQLNN